MDERDELLAPAPDPIHALLDEAAKHRLWVTFGGTPLCGECGYSWPCLVAKMSTLLYSYHKERIQSRPSENPMCKPKMVESGGDN